jgi:hypothetical protein
MTASGAANKNDGTEINRVVNSHFAMSPNKGRALFPALLLDLAQATGPAGPGS